MAVADEAMLLCLSRFAFKQRPFAFMQSTCLFEQLPLGVPSVILCCMVGQHTTCMARSRVLHVCLQLGACQCQVPVPGTSLLGRPGREHSGPR